MKDKLYQVDFINNKTFCVTKKKQYKENEKTSHRWEKITAIHINDIGLIPTVYKELLKLLEDKQSNF